LPTAPPKFGAPECERRSTTPPGDDMFGVSVSEHPTEWQNKQRHVSCDGVADDLLDPAWRYPFEASPGVIDRRLPPEVATKYPLPE
jgi:hypothetical protein